MTTSNELPRWSDQIVVEDVAGVPFRMYRDRPRRVAQLLSLAERWGGRAHLLHLDRAVGFDGLRRGAGAKAVVLAESGVRTGDHVVLFGWNSPDYVMNFWACIQLGAVPVLCNAWWGDREIDYALDLIKPTFVLADERSRKRIPDAWRRGPWKADETAAGAPADLPSVNETPDGENETAVIVFTSGTGGAAKAVALSHRALLSGLQTMLHITKQLPLRFDHSRSEIALHSGPLFHVGGPQAMLRSIAVGNTLVFPGGRFDPADILALVERHKVTRWTAVPTMIMRVLDHPDIATRDVRSLKSIGMGGAPVGSSLLERLKSGFPNAQPSVAVGYGLTENTGPATTASGADSVNYPGTCGRPLPSVEIRINPRPGLPNGEVLIRAPMQMSGYVGLAETPIDAEGWLHTGDLGKMDEGGRLWITGRSKDMIIRGGENIAPAAVESALLTLPQVAEAAVFGMPHPDLGEEVMAVVALKEPATVEQLQVALRPILASFAVPSRWRLQTEALPTNQTGKIDKPAIAAEARRAGQA